MDVKISASWLRQRRALRVEEDGKRLDRLEQPSLSEDGRPIGGVPASVGRIFCEVVEGDAVARLEDGLVADGQSFLGCWRTRQASAGD